MRLAGWVRAAARGESGALALEAVSAVDQQGCCTGYDENGNGEGRHDVLYRRLPVNPKMLVKGAKRIELLSDTAHDGIEVLLPGPALLVRSRRAGDGVR